MCLDKKNLKFKNDQSNKDKNAGKKKNSVRKEPMINKKGKVPPTEKMM